MNEKVIQIFNYSVQNQAGTVDIFIDGDIVDASTQEIMKNFWGDETSVSFKSFRNQVNEAKPKIINVTVTSDGGHVGDAMAIYDFLQDLKKQGVTVNTKATGIVASAATYPAMAGGPENSTITDNGWAMIHNVSGGVWGSVDVIERYGNTLRKFNNRIIDFYTEQTGQKHEDVTEWMNGEEWMDAETARNRGFFAKTVVPAENHTKAIKPENWFHKNKSVLEAYNKSVKPIPTNENTMFEKFEEMFKNALEKFGIKTNDKGETIGLTVANLNSAMKETLDGLETTITDAINTKVDAEAKKISDSFAKVLDDAKFAKNEIVEKLTDDLKTANDTITEIQNDLVNSQGQAKPPGGNATKDEFAHEGISFTKD